MGPKKAPKADTKADLPVESNGVEVAAAAASSSGGELARTGSQVSQCHTATESHTNINIFPSTPSAHDLGERSPDPD